MYYKDISENKHHYDNRMCIIKFEKKNSKKTNMQGKVNLLFERPTWALNLIGIKRVTQFFLDDEILREVPIVSYQYDIACKLA